MPSSRKLKVFRTPIGFHDAYVAAPSKKAALEAWGSTRDLFASGAAELVEDPDLTREPLARPGEVIRRSRGSLAEQIAALPEDRPKVRRAASRDEPAPHRKRPPPPPKPRPDRAPLDQAERALAETERRHSSERDAIERREAELKRERRTLEGAQSREVKTMRDARDQLQASYDRAMKSWRG